MPHAGSIAEDVVEVLRAHPEGATLAEIRRELTTRRGEVLPHSVRRAIYGHLGDKGERLFRRLGSGQRDGRYGLQEPSERAR